MKRIYIIILIGVVVIYFVVGFNLLYSPKKLSNYRESKGSIVVLIKKKTFQRSVTPYTLYLRSTKGVLEDYSITAYEKSLINIGDTIK